MSRFVSRVRFGGRTAALKISMEDRISTTSIRIRSGRHCWSNQPTRSRAPRFSIIFAQMNVREASTFTVSSRACWGQFLVVQRSEERRGGNEFVSPCRSGWSPYHEKKTKDKIK